MTYTSLRRTQQATDLLATDHLAECPDCHELAHPTATVCEGCGSALFPNSNATAQQKEAIVPDESECVCGTCARCALASYEPDIAVLNTVHDTLEAAIARPGNVAELRRWSVKV